jgi:hypothetical protein
MTACIFSFLIESSLNLSIANGFLGQEWLGGKLYEKQITGSSKVSQFVHILPDVINLFPKNIQADKNIVTCRPISTQRLKYVDATIEKVLQEVFTMWSAPCPLLGNGSLNTFPQKHTVEQ